MVVKGDGGCSDRGQQGNWVCDGEAAGGDGNNGSTNSQRRRERVKGS